MSHLPVGILAVFHISSDTTAAHSIFSVTWSGMRFSYSIAQSSPVCVRRGVPAADHTRTAHRLHTLRPGIRESGAGRRVRRLTTSQSTSDRHRRRPASRKNLFLPVFILIHIDAVVGQSRPDVCIVLDFAEFRHPTSPQDLKIHVAEADSFERRPDIAAVKIRIADWRRSLLRGKLPRIGLRRANQFNSAGEELASYRGRRNEPLRFRSLWRPNFAPVPSTPERCFRCPIIISRPLQNRVSS